MFFLFAFDVIHKPELSQTTYGDASYYSGDGEQK
jgi:hypothetical protein